MKTVFYFSIFYLLLSCKENSNNFIIEKNNKSRLNIIKKTKSIVFDIELENKDSLFFEDAKTIYKTKNHFNIPDSTLDFKSIYQFNEVYELDSNSCLLNIVTRIYDNENNIYYLKKVKSGWIIVDNIFIESIYTIGKEEVIINKEKNSFYVSTGDISGSNHGGSHLKFHKISKKGLFETFYIKENAYFENDGILPAESRYSYLEDYLNVSVLSFDNTNIKLKYNYRLSLVEYIEETDKFKYQNIIEDSCQVNFKFYKDSSKFCFDSLKSNLTKSDFENIRYHETQELIPSKLNQIKVKFKKNKEILNLIESKFKSID